MRTLKKLFTAEELLRLPTDGLRLELVKGKLYEMPPDGARHGNVAIRIASRLNAHVETAELGQVFAAETGFVLRRDPDTVRAPDAAFVSRDRLPQGELPVGFLELAPDLVVEVVSPSDSRREVREKAESWLLGGTRLVWVINPATRSATVYRSLDNFSDLSEDDTLDGEDVVPGLACQLRELFA
jgi:Uma2 family endonuclease